MKAQIEREETNMTGIVVGIDGSAHSARALEWAMNEAVLRHAPLTVLSVHRVMVSFWDSPFGYPEPHDQLERAREMAREAIGKALAQRGDEHPASVTTRVLIGAPAEELLRAAEDADMIVVGSRGTGGFARLLMGSVCTQITHHARCPVIVIPAEDRR
jgi:nucleotide-binding universal stress UspA family protein